MSDVRAMHATTVRAMIMAGEAAAALQDELDYRDAQDRAKRLRIRSKKVMKALAKETK